MQRRQFLAIAGLAGVSGCTEIIGSTTGPPTTTPPETDPFRPTTGAPDTEEPGTPSEAPSELQNASVVDLETAPLTYAMTPTQYRTPDDGEITTRFTETATAEHPATLAATLTNANDFSNTFRIEWTPPFGRLTSRIPQPFVDEYANTDATYRVGLVLVPTENHDLVDDAPEFERDAEGYWRLAGRVGPSLPEQVRLDVGETIHGEYAIVGRPEGEGRGRPTGVYEFRGIDESTLRLAVWETASPGPDGESRFEGIDLPTLPGEATTAWYHDADSTTSTYLQPSSERGELPEQSRFTFVNKSRATTQCGHWNLYKLVEGQWFHIGPYAHTADCRLLFPGQTKSWTLNAYHGEALPRIGYDGNGDNYGFLGGGRYGAVVGYGSESDQSGALVELVGDAVSIVPTDDVTSSQSGATVTVTSSRWEDSEEPPSATLTLTRAEDVDRVLIPEQVMRRRHRGLRNTLAFVAEDVDTVVLRTDERIAEQAVGYESGSERFRLLGHGVYEVVMERRTG